MDVHGGGKIADFNPGEEGEVINLFPGQSQGDTAHDQGPQDRGAGDHLGDPPGQQPAHGGIDDAATQRQQQ